MVQSEPGMYDKLVTPKIQKVKRSYTSTSAVPLYRQETVRHKVAPEAE